MDLFYLATLGCLGVIFRCIPEGRAFRPPKPPYIERTSRPPFPITKPTGQPRGICRRPVGQRLGRNRHKCPIYTCLEMSFLKTEAEITSRPGRPGVQSEFKKLPKGSNIKIRSARSKTKPQQNQVPSRSKRSGIMGCLLSLDVLYGYDVTITDESRNETYDLVQVSSSCGTAMYQPVIEVGCRDQCCDGGTCLEEAEELPYLVWEGGVTVVKWITTVICCDCKNIG